MKIVHIATGYPIRFHGGITNYVRTLAESQVREGHDVTVVAAPHTADAAPVPFKEVEYRSRTLRPFSLRIVSEDPDAADLVRNVLEMRPDLIHFHMGLDLALNFYDEIARSGVPYVISVHDYYLVCPRITMIDYQDDISRNVDLEKCARCIGVLDQIDILEKARRHLKMRLPRLPSKAVYRRNDVMRRFLRGSACVLPVSSRVEEIVRAVEPGARYEVMHIGNASANAAVLSKVPSDKIRVTILGVLSHHKGAGVVESILSLLSRTDLQVHFYGRSDRDTLKRLGVKGLIYHGSYTPGDLQRIMAVTDLGLVCPIWEDNAPQVVMEFLNYGVPVAGSKMGGIPDFVNASNGRLFDPHSQQDVAAFASWLNAVTRQELDALTPVRRLKTPAQHCEEVLELYRNVARR